MPTVREYLNALVRDYSIEVVSSDYLLKGVRRKQRLRVQELFRKGKPYIPMKTQLSKISSFDPSLTILIKPIQLLHSVGRIATPPVPNLADISSTWAIIRYIWAFDTGGGYRNSPLILSETARKIDFHQKTLLSDEVGMGMAFYLMTNYFGTNHVRDVSEVVNDPAWSVYQQYPASPDYIFFDDSFKQFYVVECKGNQTSYDTMLNQIRRGTEQVPSIVFQNGHQSISLIIGTCMLEDNTNVYVVDPPNGDKDEEYYDEDELLDDKRIFQAKWFIENEEEYLTNSHLFDRAKILNFAGLESEAIAQLLPEQQDYWKKYVRTQIKTEILETKFGDYTGTKEVFTTYEGLRLELFRGILSDLRERFFIPLGDQATRIKRGLEQVTPREEFLSQFKNDSFNIKVEESNEHSIVQSVCRDGTIFQFTISEE